MEIDEYDLVDPVDILTPLEKSGFWDGVVCDLFSVHYLLFVPSYDICYIGFHVVARKRLNGQREGMLWRN